MIHVVYNIRKKGESSYHDIIVHSDMDWKSGNLVTGGLTESLRKDFPIEDYTINVEVMTSQGKQVDE